MLQARQEALGSPDNSCAYVCVSGRGVAIYLALREKCSRAYLVLDEFLQSVHYEEEPLVVLRWH
jgi:hypothetical protein